jgi:hypothetical protein
MACCDIFANCMITGFSSCLQGISKQYTVCINWLNNLSKEDEEAINSSELINLVKRKPFVNKEYDII